jgi:hypothetical protein
MMMWPMPDDDRFFGGQQPQPGAGDPDVRLAFDVAQRLVTDERIGRQRIVLEVQHGVVLLTGSVDTPDTRELAGAVAREVPGVRDVSNALHTVEGHTDEFQSIVATLADESPARPPTPSLLTPLLLLSILFIVVTAATALLGR